MILPIDLPSFERQCTSIGYLQSYFTRVTDVPSRQRLLSTFMNQLAVPRRSTSPPSTNGLLQFPVPTSGTVLHHTWHLSRCSRYSDSVLRHFFNYHLSYPDLIFWFVCKRKCKFFSNYIVSQKGTPTLSIVTLSRINGFWQFLAQIFLTQLAVKWLFKFPPHPTSVSTLFFLNLQSIMSGSLFET